ncbi:hypothetical protein [Campylobacter concisus]|uniref:hypothetical protein n=1 Tax=Campylobacter concisus TaxID=199 RepID=UPI0011E799FF|nr:hypothetical protein [Campylobacter concisus]
MKRIFLFVILVIFASGCSSGRHSIPLNKGAYKQTNIYSISEALNLEAAKKELEGFENVRLEFGSNDQNKSVIKANVKVQRFITDSGDIKGYCQEAFVAVMKRYMIAAKKQNADVANIVSFWRADAKYLKDEFVCMSSRNSVGVVMRADLVQK